MKNAVNLLINETLFLRHFINLNFLVFCRLNACMPVFNLCVMAPNVIINLFPLARGEYWVIEVIQNESCIIYTDQYC